MHCSPKVSAALLLLVTASDAFMAPGSAFRSSSALLTRMQSRHEQAEQQQRASALIDVPCNVVALGVGAAAVSAFGTVDAAIAATAPLPPQEKMVYSPTTMSQQQILTSMSTSNALPPQMELVEKASANYAQTSPAMSSSSFLSAAASTNLASTGVVIKDIQYDGKVPNTEADEYVVISNESKSPVDISKYYIYVATTGTQGPTFYFPANTVLKPGASVRIYTNEIHKETGGYSFGSGKAIWSNKGGLGVLRDASGKKVMEFKYKPTN